MQPDRMAGSIPGTALVPNFHFLLLSIRYLGGKIFFPRKMDGLPARRASAAEGAATLGTDAAR
jgi:hypothetical protein